MKKRKIYNFGTVIASCIMAVAVLILMFKTKGGLIIMVDYGLKDKVAIVTGAGRGIGRGIALALAKEGANVVIVDVLEEHAAQVAKEVTDFGVDAVGLKVDVADKEAVHNLVKIVLNRFNRIDILVNNAGISPKKSGRKVPILEMDPLEWERVIAVNLHGSFYCAQECARAMIEHKYGKIINMSSLAGRIYVSIPGVHYLASKAGVIGLTRGLAGELAPFGINVNAIAPGRIESEMIHKVPDEVNKEYIKQIPTGRFGTAEDIANAVLFLASDKASYITGVTLDVNGGKLIL